MYTDSAGEQALARAFGDVDVSAVADDWERRWRSFHQPVRLGSLWIGPPWRTPPGDALAVVIDPGRAFGTGAHETTRLCLELLEELRRGSVLDVGCGSGVLSIAAAKLGFGPVVAVDTDPNAVEATAANARRNGVGVDVRAADGRADALPSADVAVANIALDVVDALLPRLDVPVAVTSGYRAEDRFAPDGWLKRVAREREGWAAHVWQRASPT